MSTLPKALLADLYRFAWLIAGEAALAEEALASAVAELPKLEQLRSAASRSARLVQHIRQHCLRSKPAAETAPRLLRSPEENSLEMPEFLDIEAYIVAQRFQTLPEPERSALALFYLPLISQRESATLLGQTVEQYCEALGRARERLYETLQTLRQPAGAPSSLTV